MSGAASPAVIRARRRRPWPAVRNALAALWHGLVFLLLALLGIGPVLAILVAILVARNMFMKVTGRPAGGPYLSGTDPTQFILILCTLLYLRWLTRLTRWLAGRWCGTAIASPYRPAPAEPGIRARLTWIATDPATWRDLLWLPVNAVAGTFLAGLPVLMAGSGIAVAMMWALQLPGWRAPGPGVGLLGLALAGAGLWAAPRLLRGYGSLARILLGPTRGAELTVQVEHLARTRTDTIDTGAAELRRIERDLHDGAQARLVAMGMTLDAIERQLETSPAAARALLAEAKQSSVSALSELRDLVRGIQPPVLADRGLVAAVRALALDSPLRARVTAEITGRPPAPVESAAYFAVSELLANAAKHAGPCDAWIDIRHSGGMLRIGVADDGRGGADQTRGTGLSGIERRLAAFDGLLAVSSPPGGPTVVNMEIPCALSSPKTISC
jgi:signal transduction histidine kinase